MSPSDTLSKETAKITKPKKEKSSKKRKTSAFVDTNSMVSTVPENERVSESTAVSPTLPTPVLSRTSDDEALQKSTKAIKPKKENSSKKRKSSALNESASEQTTSTAVSIAAQSPHSDDEAARAPPIKKRKASVEEIEVDINAPEPPSKKALRALKKGKSLPPSKSGAESTPEPEPKKEKKAEVEKRSEHGVWIGNLPFSVSKEVLRTFLVDHSDITADMITRVHMPGPNDTKPANKVVEKKFGKIEHNKGFAYVDFSTAEAAENAVELSEQLLSGRRLLIKNHNSFEGRPQKTKEESRNDGKPPSKRIFLGNLSYDVTEEVLKEHFEKCGAIESVKVATFEDSGKCKGYAWIVFEALEAAQNAVCGWVYVEEEASDALESESGEESEEGEKVSKPKKTKRRKWWVNKIKGRPLRMEFAEGAEVRYKKRYGKDGTKNSRGGAAEASVGETKENRMPSRLVKAPEYRQPTKGVEYDRPYGAPRLTGGIVKSEGKKVTF
jgi:hypothetical protein